MKFRKIIKGIYALWYREFKVFLREKSRVAGSVFLPLFWYFIFGGGMSAVTDVGGNYQHFIFPGFLAMAVIFSAMFNGAYVVWDKKIDFLKEVLITPLSRTTIFFGKVLGGSTDALLQVVILMIVGLIIGIPFTAISLILSLLLLILFTIGLVSLGLILGAFLESPEGFGMIASFIIYPLFLLSGALYPIDHLPAWMQVLTHADPATYAVDALRYIILGKSSLPLFTSLLVLVLFDFTAIAVGTWAFNRMKL